MKLIIDIDEEQYKFIKQSMTIDKVKYYHALVFDICEHISKGTPLPKEHGRLLILSEDAVKREYTSLGFSCQSWISDVGLFDATVAIIEADKAKSEKNVQIDKQTLWDRAGTSNHITRADVNVRPPKDNSGTQALNEGYTSIANKYS